MIGEASSSAPSYLSGSTGLSHVYIQYPPLRCHVPGSRSLFYDDGNKLILSLTPNEVIFENAHECRVQIYWLQLNILCHV